MNRCGKKTRQGAACKLKAGFGTDHVGEGACKFHGGATPVKHGRYSKVKRSEIRKLIETYEADPDPLNLTAELATARALLASYLEKHGSEAFEFKGAVDLVAEVSRIVKRIEDIGAQNAISRPELFRVMGEMGRVARRVVEKYVEATPVQKLILEEMEDGWVSIRVG